MSKIEAKELMATLGCTEAEALDIIKCDYAIDHGERVYFDMTKEEEKQAKKIGNVPRGRKMPTAYKFAQKKPKENPTKEKIVQFLFEILPNLEVSELKVANKTRQLTFSYENKQYELNLIEKRQKKA